MSVTSSDARPLMADGDDAFTLQILHASDLEGGVDAIDRAPYFAAIVDALEETAENTLVLSAGDNVIPGPFFNAALFTDDAVFNTAHNAIFGLEGDSVYEALEGGRGHIDMAIMNAIGFDASALGNHEFDTGTGTLGDFIKPALEEDGLADDEWVGTTFPYLSANLDFSADGELSGTASTDFITMADFATGPDESASGTASNRIAPAALFEVGGEKIGVVGATTPLLDTISSPGDVTVVAGDNDMDALAAVLQPVIDSLIEAGANKIILTTHLQQIALEKELVGKLSGVDVIIAGGSDTLQADDTDTLQPGDEADETYPFVTENADGETAIIVSTDGEYSYVGRLVVGFDADGVVNADSLDPEVNGAYAATETVVADLWGEEDAFADGTKGDLVADLVAGVDSVVSEQDGNIQGQTDVFLEGRRSAVRTEETNLGNLTAEANLAVARAHDETVMVSIKNGGGIRAPIGETLMDGTLVPPQANADVGKDDGDISQLDIVNALRFNNGLTLQTLSHEQLVAVLEHAVAESGDGATPGQFAQVAGVTYSFDPTAEPGDRIMSAAITYGDDDHVIVPLVSDGEFVGREDGTVRIVTLGFLQGGGDDYPFADFAEALGEETADVVNLEDVLTEDGASTFADPGSEQDALAEYLAETFSGDSAYDAAETPASEDTRIQNLSARDDAVFSGMALFDEDLYLTIYPDVADAVEAGLVDSGRDHFLAFGGDEGRWANPFFNGAYYLRENPAAAASDLNPLVHYLTIGWTEGFDPSSRFDTSDYLAANPEAGADGTNPLQHLLETGLAAGLYTPDVADVG